MQNKGIVKFITLLLVLVCIFYLSFSFVTRHYENKAAAMGEEAGQEYLDSIMNEKVYLGIYSLKQCREMEIGLGLDLKGGMNVVLEVSVPDVISVLADHKTDPAFVKSMNEAKQEEETSQDDFISLFVKSYHKNAPGHRLAEIFATQQMKGKVSTQSTDAEVERALRAEADEHIGRLQRDDDARKQQRQADDHQGIDAEMRHLREDMAQARLVAQCAQRLAVEQHDRAKLFEASQHECADGAEYPKQHPAPPSFLFFYFLNFLVERLCIKLHSYDCSKQFRNSKEKFTILNAKI